MNRFGALRSLGGRKSAPEKPEAAPETGLGGSLARAGEAVAEVVRAAERAADQIAADAESRGEGRASVIDRERVASELMKSLAERTDALRSEAHELARILERAAPLVAAADVAGDTSQDSPATSAPAPPPAPPVAAAPAPPAVEPAPPYGPAGGSVPPPSASAAPPVAPAEPSPALEPVAEEPAPEPAPEPIAESIPEPADARPAPLQPLGHSGRGAQPNPSEGIRLLATQMAVAGSSHHEIEERLRREFGVSDADEIIAEVFGAEE